MEHNQTDAVGASNRTHDVTSYYLCTKCGKQCDTFEYWTTSGTMILCSRCCHMPVRVAKAKD